MKTCLVVDDSKVVRQVAGKILRRLEFEIVEAGDGAEALTECRNRMPDAVLLDWNLPVMDSVQFLREMRTLPGGKDPLVVFCGGEGNTEEVEQAFSAGANDFVAKPFDGYAIESKFQQIGLI